MDILLNKRRKMILEKTVPFKLAEKKTTLSIHYFCGGGGVGTAA